MANTATNIINLFDFNSAGKQEIQEIGDSKNYGSFSAFHHAINASIGSADDMYLDDPPIPDGKIHRFGAKKAGWYILFENSNGLAVGEYGDWRDSQNYKWSNWQDRQDDSTDSQYSQYRQMLEELSRKREQELRQLQNEAKNKAKEDYEKSTILTPNMTHPYLETKGVKAHGDIRIRNGKLLLPIRNDNQEIISYQTISPTGDKLFLKDGQKQGGYFLIEAATDNFDAVAIVEGYATGASIHEATGYPVLVAFDAGNLPIVAKNLRAQEPSIDIIICGDNDANNKGQDAALKAQNMAKNVGCKTFIAIPDKTGMDWNDYHAQFGLDALKNHILNIVREEGDTDNKNIIRTCPNVLEWNSVDRFSGKAPDRKMLISETIPMGAVTLFAAMGDAGKGMICLDLALKVASKDNLLASAFGKEIMEHGKVVVISAEDDAGEIHRRIQNLGQPEHDLYVVPLPNAGGILPLVEEKRGEGIRVTAGYVQLKQQLMAMDNLKLIIIDPLASFIMADINADPACAAYVTGTLAALAQETGASVIVPHHMTKTKSNITTPEEARSLVRGSTALVDGVRCCYVLWQASEADKNKLCAAIQEKPERNKVFYGCVVKSNGPSDREIKTYIRNKIGLLEVKNTTATRKIKAENEHQLELLEKIIAWGAAKGHPFTESHTSPDGIFPNLHRLPKSLQHLGRKEIASFVKKLITEGRVLKYRLKNGVGKAQWLDVPDGVMSKGLCELKDSAAPVWSQNDLNSSMAD